jgi:iron-sulfur cluster assembly protein
MTLTASAQLKLTELRPEGNRLRVAIQGGGCSGLSYKLSWEPWTPLSPLDRVLWSGALEVVSDLRSALFLEHVELDYTEGLNGKGFEFHNPKAVRTCGCGSSFSV